MNQINTRPPIAEGVEDWELLEEILLEKLERLDPQNFALVWPRVLEYLYYAVGLIEDPTIQRAVVKVLANEVDLRFFTIPASSSGMLHPAWQNSPGGILRHCVEMSLGAQRLMHKYPELLQPVPLQVKSPKGKNYTFEIPLPEAYDVLRAAISLHDSFVVPRENYPHHAELAAEAWRRHSQEVAIDQVGDVYRTILFHEGRFSPNWEKAPKGDPFIQIMRDLDMLFSDVYLGRLFEPKDLPIPPTDEVLLPYNRTG